jgi:hypothetical protein
MLKVSALIRKIKDLSAKSNVPRAQVSSYRELVYALVIPSPTSVKSAVLSARRLPLNSSFKEMESSASKTLLLQPPLRRLTLPPFLVTMVTSNASLQKEPLIARLSLSV